MCKGTTNVVISGEHPRPQAFRRSGRHRASPRATPLEGRRAARSSDARAHPHERHARPTCARPRGALRALFHFSVVGVDFFGTLPRAPPKRRRTIRTQLVARVRTVVRRRWAIVLLHLARTDFFSRGSTMGINMTWSVPCGGCQETLTKASNPKKCGKCHSVWYCSKECQTLDWKRPNKQGHKHLCAALAAANKTEGAGRPRSEKALNKPEMEDTRGLLDRFNEILTTQVLPGTQTYAMMSKMLEDGVAKGARAMLIIHEQVLGNGKISFSIVPEEKVEVLLKNDAGFSRHALMVRTYDPKTQFVICFETGSPEKFIVTRLVAEDVIDPRRGRHRPGVSS